MESYTENLVDALRNAADNSNAKAMEAYMRNQFKFFGIKSTQRKEIARPFLKKENRPRIDTLDKVIKELWEDSHREVQLVAMELLDKYKNQLGPTHFELVEYMLCTKSWWDTVDYIASTLVGNLIKRFPKEGYAIIEKWRYSGNMWLVRTCIIFQLKYKDEVDEALLFSLIEENSADKEFFIRKAIGWSLRQYARVAPERVQWYVDHHELSGLSRREALKHLG